MPEDEISSIPISLNSMDDDDLYAFVRSPTKSLGPVWPALREKGIELKISPLTDPTKMRIENLMKNKGFPQLDIEDRIKQVAMVKVKNVEVID